MSGSPAAKTTAMPRVLVLDGDRGHEVFEVVGVGDGQLRVRTPFLFEIGEQLRVRIEQGGEVSEATARVSAHVGDGAKITELELSDRTSPRKVVSG